MPDSSTGPIEIHPTRALRNRIETTNRLGGARCVVCGRRGPVALRPFAILTIHHRIPKRWWKAPGRQHGYFQTKQHRGTIYWRDCFTNTLEVCHKCHERVSRLPVIVPDLMGDKLRRIMARDIRPLADEDLRLWRLFPDIVAEAAFEITLAQIRDFEEARAAWKREVADATLE